MYKVNKAQLLRMKLFINALDDKAGVKGLALPDLSETEMKIAWNDAVRLVKQISSVGIINESDRLIAAKRRIITI